MLGVSQENIKLSIYHASKRLALLGPQEILFQWEPVQPKATIQMGPLFEGDLRPVSCTGCYYLYNWSENQGVACIFIEKNVDVDVDFSAYGLRVGVFSLNDAGWSQIRGGEDRIST